MKTFAAVLFHVVAASAQVRIFNSADIFRAAPDGIEIRSGVGVVRISALRDDVLRIRLGPNGTLPEDAPWAVLPAARTARVSVTPLSNGFSTAKLRVRVDQSLRMTISDLAGNVISSEIPERPIEYHGDSLRIYKDMPQDEHYFGLGDKTGPLDRCGMAFTLWNTDTGFQESTDPIYKSIPFFIGLRAGRSYGLLFHNTWRSSFDFGKEVRDSYSFGAAKGPPAIMEIVIKPALAELPVFVRGGSIIPLKPLVQSTSENPKGPLELRVYSGANCHGSIYQDDGISFAYKQGEFLRQEFSCGASASEVQVKFSARQGDWAPWWKETEVVLYGWQSPDPNRTSVRLDGQSVSGSRYDAARGVLRTKIPAQARAGELRIKSK